MFKINSFKNKLFPLKSIYIFEDFLSDSECNSIIELLNSNSFNKARQFSLGRNNKEMFINDKYFHNLITKKFKASLYSFLKFKKFSKPFEFYKYDDGDFIKPHTDSPRLFSDNTESNYTAIIYLNDNFDGGATYFNDLDKDITPKKGLLLLFDHSLKHEAKTVNNGIKFIYRSNWLLSR